MVMKLYDSKLNYLTGISEFKDLRVTEELETGYQTAQFSLPYTILVKEEQKIDIDGYRYVIKEVNMEDLGLYDVYCKPYFGKLQGKHIDSLTGYGMNLDECLETIVEETGWTFVMKDVAGSYQVNIQHMSALDAIEALIKLYQVEVKWDTLNQVLYVYNKRQDKETHFILDGRNLRKCQVQSSTYDLITRLIPIGKDEIMLNGQTWVENYEYTDEIIVGYYIDSSIENRDDLLKTASQKVLETGRPQTTYKVLMTEIPTTLDCGDEVRVLDKIRGINVTKRVMKTVKYFDRPEDSYVELGSLGASFDKIYKDLEKAQKIVNEKTLRSIYELSKEY